MAWSQISCISVRYLWSTFDRPEVLRSSHRLFMYIVSDGARRRCTGAWLTRMLPPSPRILQAELENPLRFSACLSISTACRPRGVSLITAQAVQFIAAPVIWSALLWSVTYRVRRVVDGSVNKECSSIISLIMAFEHWSTPNNFSSAPLKFTFMKMNVSVEPLFLP